MKALPYGEGGIYLDLEIDDAPDRAARTHAVARYLRSRLSTADVVVGAGTIAVLDVGAWDALDDVVADAARVLAEPLEEPDEAPPLVLDAIYDGPDLDDVAALSGLSRDRVLELHSSRDYRVELTGFLPGFGYLGPVDPRLALPRRATPRPSVAASSLAIAGGFTGVYPTTSPGGWHLLGRVVDFVPFDLARTPHVAFTPGRRVRFRPVEPRASRVTMSRNETMRSTAPALLVERAPACATVQDAGRAGRLGEGLSPSGPLDPSAFVAANLAVGNEARAAAIEVPLGRLEVRASGALRVSVDGETAVELADGDRFVVAPSRRAVRYLAIAGGVDVEPVLGSRSTFLAARFGGFAGRPLRARDVVPIGEARGARASFGPSAPRDPDDVARLVVDPGPHLASFPDDALEHLLRTSYRVSRLGDRVGVRLEGAPLPHAPARLRLPVPMVRGAIEITPDGAPIVLGPDHPTTGGYPVLAVVRRASQASLARLAPGHELRFALG